jgi:hypothetical protein
MSLAYLLPQLLFSVPTAVTLVIGIVLISARRGRMTPRSRGFGLAGCVVLLVAALVQVAYSATLAELVRGRPTASQVQLVADLFAFVSLAINCVGLALLIASVLAGSAPTGAVLAGSAPGGASWPGAVPAGWPSAVVPPQPGSPAWGGTQPPSVPPVQGHPGGPVRSDDPGWRPPTA